MTRSRVLPPASGPFDKYKHPSKIETPTSSLNIHAQANAALFKGKHTAIYFDDMFIGKYVDVNAELGE